MIFDDPLSARSPAQLTALAETTRTFMDIQTRRLSETRAKMESMGAALHGETEGLRAQAGSVIHGLQEQATAVLSQMLGDQTDARARLESVISGANSKFAEVDSLMLQTRSGVEEIAAFAPRPGAQPQQLTPCNCSS